MFKLVSLRAAIQSPTPKYRHLISITLKLLSVEDNFELVINVLKRHINFFEGLNSDLSWVPWLHKWIANLERKRSIDDHEFNELKSSDFDNGTIEYSLYSSFMLLSYIYQDGQLPRHEDAYTYIYDSLLRITDSFYLPIRNRFPLLIDSHLNVTEDNIDEKLAYLQAYFNDPERLKLQADIWLPIIVDIEERLTSRQLQEESSTLAQLPHSWPEWTLETWDLYLKWKEKNSIK
jgi:hypothetical protein